MIDPRESNNCKPGTLVKLRTGEIGKVKQTLAVLDYHPLGTKVNLDDENETEGRVSEVIESGNNSEQNSVTEFPDEGLTIEYKGSFSVPLGTDEEIKIKYNLPNDEAIKGKIKELKDILRFSVMKTIAAFANTDGGTLYIGIKDRTKEILGLDEDYKENNCDSDGLITEIQNKMKKIFGDSYGGAILSILEMKTYEGNTNSGKKEYLKIRVKPVKNHPLSLKVDGMIKGEKIKIPKFYYRTSNGSEELPVSDFYETHWPEHRDKYN